MIDLFSSLPFSRLAIMGRGRVGTTGGIDAVLCHMSEFRKLSVAASERKQWFGLFTVSEFSSTDFLHDYFESSNFTHEWCSAPHPSSKEPA